MSRSRPPFRADHVGSLLRPAALKEARSRHENGALSDAELRRIEDEEIKKIIARQEEIGLQSITDGEFRRSWWHFDFLKKLDGVEGYRAAEGIQFHGVQTRAEGVRVTGRIGFSGHPMIEHFKFLKANAKQTPKMTIPSPSVLHFRGGRREISSRVYPQLDAFFDDLGRAYRKAVKAFYDAGCRYLQFDDTVWAYLCSKEQLQKARERGEEVEKLP
ncbi:MAG: 5-methyltetrahydropteroyltriglutamate--homocysteine S-methyltransferase, partial [Rhodoplanes sp.]